LFLLHVVEVDFIASLISDCVFLIYMLQSCWVFSLIIDSDVQQMIFTIKCK